MYDAPVGKLGVKLADGAVLGIDFLASDTPLLPPDSPFAFEVSRQLAAYFRDGSFRFDMPMELLGTRFQRRVWEALRAIPAGTTRRYGELAQALHTGARAIGSACGANPLPIIIPCHRVVGACSLGGYTGSGADGGLGIKRWLLDHERRS